MAVLRLVAYCADMTQSEANGLVPVDTFRVRLAIVRTLMGWNYEEAQGATGVPAENWRLWEKGLRRCSDVTGVASAIAHVTPYSKTWLIMGGPLAEEGDAPARYRQPARRSAVTPIRRVKSSSNHGCMRSTRLRVAHRTVTCTSIAA